MVKAIAITAAGSSRGMAGERNPRWNGGRRVRSDGYVVCYAPGHPYAYRNFVLEHRLVMEGYLCRYLTPNEHVRHKNHNRSDNRLENLELMSAADHARHHNKGKKHPSRWKPRASKRWIIQQYKSGKTIRECGELAGISYGAMRRHFEEYGIPFNKIGFRGDHHYKGTLTERDVRRIKKERARHGKSYCQLAKEFGTTKGTIACIIAGKTWKNVT